MKHYLVLSFLKGVNDRWYQQDVTRYVRQCEDDFVIAVKEVRGKQWKTIKRTLVKIIKNKKKRILKMFDLD